MMWYNDCHTMFNSLAMQVQTHVRRGWRRAGAEDEVEYGEEEGGSLPGARLGTGH